MRSIRVIGAKGAGQGAWGSTYSSVTAVSAEIVDGTVPTRRGKSGKILRPRPPCVGSEHYRPGGLSKGCLRRQRVLKRTATVHVRGLEQRAYTSVIPEAHVKRPIASGSEPLRTTPLAGLSWQPPRAQPNEQFHCHVPTAIESTARTSQQTSVAGTQGGWHNVKRRAATTGETNNDGRQSHATHFACTQEGVRACAHMTAQCAHVTAHTQQRDGWIAEGERWAGCEQRREGRGGRKVRK